MRRDEPANVMHLIKPLMLMMILVIALVVAELASADTVRVHDAAGSVGPEVTLSQIAELTGEYAPTLGDVVVGRFADGADTLEIELSDVRSALAKSGAAVGRLNLQGFAVCKVHQTGEPRISSGPLTDDGSTRRPSVGSVSEPVDNEAPAANTERESITVQTPTTVRAAILDQVAHALGLTPRDLEVTFDDRHRALLDESTVAGRYTAEPVIEPRLGEVSFRVRAFRGTQEIRQQTVQVTVRQRVLAVVAVSDIQRGEIIHRGSVRVREVLIDDRSGTPVADPALIVGQVASRSVAAGDLVTAGQVEAPIAVRRREHVEVTLQQGALRITFTGEAQDQAAVGDTIQVRNPQTKQMFIAVVTGRRQVFVGEMPESEG